MARRVPSTVLPIALVTLGLSSRPAAADWFLENKLSSGTRYGGDLARQVESPGFDGGILGVGWRVNGLWVSVTVIGRDVNTVNGGHEYNLAGAGPGLRYEQALPRRFAAYVRGGLEIVDVSGEVSTPLDTAWGWDISVAGGVAWTAIRGRELDLVLTAEVLTQTMRLYPDDAKPLEGRATSVVFGPELRVHAKRW